MKVTEQYPERDSIDPRAFAFRHMLLEEIKTRKINGDRRPELAELARGLSVTYAPHDKVYIVKVDGEQSIQVGADEVLLYQRGERDDSTVAYGREDPILAVNNRLAVAIVEDLLKKVKVDSLPLHPVGTQRGRLVLDAEMCPPCRICGANEASVKATLLETCEDMRFLGDFKVFECRSCHNMFTYPLPDRGVCQGLPEGLLARLSSRLLRLFMQMRIDRIQSMTEGRHVLNFTAGASLFTHTMSSVGFKVTSVDPHAVSRQDFGTGGAIVSDSCGPSSLSEKFHLKEGSFDIVTGWHIFEQLSDPCEALRLSFELLKPGGVLYLSVPNVAGLQAGIGGRRWAYLNVPQHVNHFSQKGLIQLLKQIGFQSPQLFNCALEYEIPGFHQTLFNMISLSHNYLHNRRSKERSVERDLLYPRWTKLMSRLNFVLLPISLVCAGLAILLKRPCCVEVVVHKPALKY